jgi:hypothetical protein
MSDEPISEERRRDAVAALLRAAGIRDTPNITEAALAMGAPQLPPSMRPPPPPIEIRSSWDRLEQSLRQEGQRGDRAAAPSAPAAVRFGDLSLDELGELTSLLGAAAEAAQQATGPRQQAILRLLEDGRRFPANMREYLQALRNQLATER